MWLAVTRTYEPRWTVEIHAEWMRNVLSDHPNLRLEHLERTRNLMDRVNPRCLVGGYERLISDLNSPDANDRHVLAAAIEAGASVIVTFNLRDFPPPALAAYRVRTMHPDTFLVKVLDQNRARFLRGIRQHRASLKNPTKTVEEYLSTLRALTLLKIAARLELHNEEI